jgi:hypothetical protein
MGTAWKRRDEELARALQAMLDQEYEEELSLCLCEQLEQEEQDRVMALRLEREGQPSGYSPGNINNSGAARFSKAHVAAVLRSSGARPDDCDADRAGRGGTVAAVPNCSAAATAWLTCK